MDTRAKAMFLALVIAQAAHSIEECALRLYEVFEPARRVGAFLGPDPATGFLIGNAAVVAFGCVCYLAWVRPGRAFGRACAWGWALAEIGNGATHLVMSLVRGAYFPGAATAPLLIAIATWLLLRLAARR